MMPSRRRAQHSDPHTSSAIDAELELRRRRNLDAGPLGIVHAVTPWFVEPTHMRPVTDLFVRVAAREPVRAVVHGPVRHAKTETLLHDIPWLILARRQIVIGYASYSADVARSKIEASEQIAARAGIPVPTSRGSGGSTIWTTDTGAVVYGAGVRGGWTSHGYDVIIVDDLLKNRAEAESPAIREARWEGLMTDLGTRLPPWGSIIMIGARLHEDDPQGRAIKRLGWPYIRLAALCDDPVNDPLGRAAGEPLWPWFWPKEALERLRDEDPYRWSGPFQGLPTRPGQCMFKGDVTWFSRWPDCGRLAQAVDLAYTPDGRSDHTVIIEGVADGPHLYITAAERFQEEASVVAERLRRFNRRHMPKRPNVYFYAGRGGDTAVGKLVAQISRVPITIVPATVNKRMRAERTATRWNRGDIMLPDPDVFPEHSDWVSWLLDGIQGFTGREGGRDDDVDALVALSDHTERVGDASDI